MKVSPSLLRYLRSAAVDFPPRPLHTHTTTFRSPPPSQTHYPPITPSHLHIPTAPIQTPTPPTRGPRRFRLSNRRPPVQLVRANKRHNLGLAILALIPLTAFALGSWQVQRLGWKTELIARYEDRLVRDPAPTTTVHRPGRR